MDIEEIVGYWSRQLKTLEAQWLHPDDKEILGRRPHSFNLDFPAAPYVGNIIGAPIIILIANPGYHLTATPYEFRCGEADIRRHLKQISHPDTADWRGAGGGYYETVKYGQMILDGCAAVVDACAYRSERISQEPRNRALLEDLPSVHFTRRWLLNCVLPLARKGQKLVVAKRWSLWNMARRSLNEWTV
ncbi:MAG: hypothetical protein OXN81_02980 [Alphaproteobacteria bacterium]|nr:hypothetical protein [Alphaproteobacteria bacterium]